MSDDKGLLEESVSKEITDSQVLPTPLAKEESKEVAESVIYIGESLPGIQQYSIFTNGFSRNIEQDMEKCPSLKELMIPISQLGTVRSQIYVKGTREYSLNLQVQQFFRGGNQ